MVVTEPSGEEPTTPRPRGLWNRLKAALRSLIGVLPDKDDNRSYCKYVLSQAFLAFGIQFHLQGLPALAGKHDSDNARMGYLRAAHYGSQAGSSFVTGPWVDRLPNRTAMVGNGFGMAATMALIPIVFLTTGSAPTLYLLIGIMVVRAFFQIFDANAAQVAYTKIISKHVGRFNRANATNTLIGGIVSMGGAMAAG